VLDSKCGPRGETPRVLVLGLPRLGATLGLEFKDAERKAAGLPRYLAQEATATTSTPPGTERSANPSPADSPRCFRL
jgi:hypothetical protein